MMRPVVLMGHDPNETFGVAPSSLGEGGVDVVLHRSPDPLPPLEDVSGVVVFGGEMNVDMTDRFPFLAEERVFVRGAVDAGVPFLGICLGAQMLARAMDRKVYPADVREFGFNTLRLTPEAATDPLVSAFHDGDMVFHWHEDTFDLPGDATTLATGDEVHLQAFRIGDLAWGLQFHFEIDRPELELWLRAAGEEVVRAWGATTTEVLGQAGRYLLVQEQRAREIFRRFAEVVRSVALDVNAPR